MALQHSLINPVVFLGYGGVGKTCLINSLCGVKFEKKYLATRGINITPIMKGNGELIANIVDTAGQELYSTDEYNMNDIFKNTKIAIFVIDNTSKLNYRRINNWMNRFQKSNPSFNGKVLLVQTKSDVEPSTNSLMADKINQELMNLVGVDTIYKVDSKNGTGIDELENIIISELENII